MKKIKFFEDAIAREEAIKMLPKGSEEQNKAYDEFYDSLDGWKCGLLNKYCEAIKRENQFIDFDDCPNSEEVLKLVTELKECGVEQITISSGWSHLPERMWAFCQNGCKIEGMVEINDRSKDWKTGEFPKHPAFLLTVEANKE